MKNKAILWFALISILIGCEEKDNMDPVGNWEISAPTPLAPSPDAALELDEAEPAESMTFEWEPATTSNRFGVAYTFLLVPDGSDEFDNPVLSLTPANGGRERTISLTAEQLDYALWAACFPAGETADLEWVVVAKAIEKEASARRKVKVRRFETEREPSTLFVSGAGAEPGADPSNAVAMRSISDGDGNPSGVFDVYTTLTAGSTFAVRDQANAISRIYGGDGGTLEACGPQIEAPETGQYRLTVDLENETYDLLKIDRWSLVGDAVEGGWGGDVPLAYKGNGIWEGEVDFLSESGFVFRANGDWAYLLKRVTGTATPDNKGGNLIMESEGNELDIEFEDIPGAIGRHKVTLDLSAGGFNYTLVEVVSEGPVQAIIGETSNPDGDAVSGNFNIADIDTPDAIYLLSGTSVVAEFTKSGDVFTSEDYVALQVGETYSLNTASDGSGDDVVGSDISVARDQAYRITVDMAAGKLIWKYYNLKLFHWDEVGGGWDSRQELLMTYIHPYKFEVTGTLSAGFHSKFISPWDVQFGTASTALTGTMENGGPNYAGISQNGTYKASIQISPDYATATYSFVKQ